MAVTRSFINTIISFNTDPSANEANRTIEKLEFKLQDQHFSRNTDFWLKISNSAPKFLNLIADDRPNKYKTTISKCAETRNR
ncbi:hypothetical protein IQ31_03919 [Sphingobacterium siyangense]|uniref:Uncharacterized protein n=1 Tax=Sphingobacterium siyangense TaxID=459529 RepID=A0A562MBB8_9SPHI|nr:hypothetical protein IQ31_03919 [Sphingobacterium siyangense]